MIRAGARAAAAAAGAAAASASAAPRAGTRAALAAEQQRQQRRRRVSTSSSSSGGGDGDMAAAAAEAAPLPSPGPPRRPHRIAVAQMTAVNDQARNFDACARLAREAAAAGCSMLFLPECFSFLGASQAESLAQAEPLDGPALARYRRLARDTGLWLSCGGFHEAMMPPAGSSSSSSVPANDGDGDGGAAVARKMHNTHVVLDSAGATVATYRKVHLFDVDVPDGPVLMESRATAPGCELVACDAPCGRVGLSVCYDLRFPEMYQALTWGLGATVLTVPSAFTKVTGEAHWELLLRARAVECQAFVVAAAQAGAHSAARHSYGHALVVDPWGRVVARLDDPDATGIAVCDLDFNELRRVRARMPIQQHRAKGREQLLLRGGGGGGGSTAAAAAALPPELC